MTLKSDAESILSREQLAAFVFNLQQDLVKNPNEWSNASLGGFLEALSAWIADMDGYYLNNNLPVPEVPSWKTFAEMLLASKYYE